MKLKTGLMAATAVVAMTAYAHAQDSSSMSNADAPESRRRARGSELRGKEEVRLGARFARPRRREADFAGGV